MRSTTLSPQACEARPVTIPYRLRYRAISRLQTGLGVSLHPAREARHRGGRGGGTEKQIPRGLFDPCSDHCMCFPPVPTTLPPYHINPSTGQLQESHQYFPNTSIHSFPTIPTILPHDIYLHNPTDLRITRTKKATKTPIVKHNLMITHRGGLPAPPTSPPVPHLPFLLSGLSSTLPRPPTGLNGGLTAIFGLLLNTLL